MANVLDFLKGMLTKYDVPPMQALELAQELQRMDLLSKREISYGSRLLKVKRNASGRFHITPVHRNRKKR